MDRLFEAAYSGHLDPALLFRLCYSTDSWQRIILIPGRVELLFVLIGCIATAAAALFVQKRLRPNRARCASRLVIVGSLAVAVLEIVILLLMAETGDHFDPRCMQAQTVCSKTP